MEPSKVVVPLAAGSDELFGELHVLTFVGTCTVHANLVHWLSQEGAKCGQWVSRGKARNGEFVVWELEQILRASDTDGKR